MLLITSCIENDIDYPVVKLQFLDIVVEGQSGNAIINTETNTITLNLDETVNLKKVKVTKLELTEGAKTDLAVNSVLDLTKPRKVTLSLYQNYEWTIVARQTIERRFVVNDQIGEPIFDVENRLVVAYVTTSTSLRTIQIEDLKLGPEGCTMAPDYSALHDFMSGQTVTVSYHDITEVWTYMCRLLVMTLLRLRLMLGQMWCGCPDKGKKGLFSDLKSVRSQQENGKLWMRLI